MAKRPTELWEELTAEQLETALQEMEEEMARMETRYNAAIETGRTETAESTRLYINELEDRIRDFEEALEIRQEADAEAAAEN